VARALALNPRLIIADEPTAGLAVPGQGEILDLMAHLQAEHGLSYRIITHDLPVLRHIADRLAIMYLGRIVEEGPAADLFARPAHPYTRALVEGVPKLDPDHRRPDAGSVEGEVPSLLRRPKGCHIVSRCPEARAACRDAKPPHVALGPERRHACLFPLVDMEETTEVR
jgi:peptide/nickel transport system ATP-binding protein